MYNGVIHQTISSMFDTQKIQLTKVSVHLVYSSAANTIIFYTYIYYKGIDTFIDVLCSKQLSTSQRKITTTNIFFLWLIHTGQKTMAKAITMGYRSTTVDLVFLGKTDDIGHFGVAVSGQLASLLVPVHDHNGG